MAPRQRPKGSAQPSHNLPLVAPPSPSPRNTISSPSIPSGTTTTNHVEPTVLPTVEPFPTQFQANFPAVITPPSAVPPVIANHTAILPQTLMATVLERPYAAVDSECVNANLFPTSFTDPFVEADAALVSAARTPSNPPSLSGSSSALFTAALAAESAAAFVASPQEDTPSGSLGSTLDAPRGVVAGHRRNMSDTSAFNKYMLTHFSCDFHSKKYVHSIEHLHRKPPNSLRRTRCRSKSNRSPCRRPTMRLTWTVRFLPKTNCPAVLWPCVPVSCPHQCRARSWRTSKTNRRCAEDWANGIRLKTQRHSVKWPRITSSTPNLIRFGNVAARAVSVI